MSAPKSVAVLGAKVLGIEYTRPEEVPAEVVYNAGNEEGDPGIFDLDSHFPSGGSFGWSPEAHSGEGSYDIQTNTAGVFWIGAPVTGLIPGLSYTVEAWCKPIAGVGHVDSAKVGVTGKSYGTPGLDSDWFRLSYTFTASSTSHELRLEATAVSGSCEALWDDITLTRDAYTETLPDLPLDVIDAEVTLDDSRNPYAEARLTVHMPADAYLEQIDPRDGLRVQLDAELSWIAPTDRAPQTRTFDLLLHERTIDHETGELTLVLESDEALLIDGGNASSAVDDGAEAHQASLRDIVDYVLAKHDAELEPGSDDADFTITDTEVRTNLVTNPSVETGITGWLTSTTNAALTRQTTFSKFGSYSLRGRTTTSTPSIGFFSDTGASITPPYPISVTAGKTYTWSYWAYTTLSDKIADARIRWASASANIGSDTHGNDTPLVPGEWTLVTVTATAPAGATNAGPWGQVSGSGNFASGSDAYFDGFIFTETDAPIDYFDGSTVDDHYDYAWTGTAHASTSTRTRKDSRDPDSLKQEPGVTDWDFLDGLVRTAGLRLFCDEQRAWRLVSPSSYRVEGETRIAEGVNATRGADTISLQATRPDGSPVWYTGVVVAYRWTDADGVQQVAYDAAGTPQKVYRIELNRPYPGPGLAASRLAQATGRGRVQELEALADLAATPGMTLVSTMPATPIQLGTVSAVTWYWAAEGDRHDLMAIRSRGLTDTPETAWGLAEGSWADVTGIGWDDIDEEGE